MTDEDSFKLFTRRTKQTVDTRVKGEAVNCKQECEVNSCEKLIASRFLAVRQILTY
jgi:hypothetical protein